MSNVDALVSVTFRHLPVDGDPADLRIDIGRPYPNPAGDWSCAVSLPEGSDAPRLVHGIDPLQALCLAVDLVRLKLEPYHGNLYWPNVDQPVPFSAYRIGGGF